jgi:hypothetical protein
MVGKDKARFSVTLPSTLDSRLREIAGTNRPKVSKNHLIELAVTRWLDAFDNRQLPLPLESRPVP